VQFESHSNRDVKRLVSATDLRYLRSFLEVARCRSFSKAAASLHLTQQAVSGHVKLLEQELGVSLLYRTTRTVTVTEIGQQFADAATELAEHIDHLWERTIERGREAAGTVHVGISLSAGYQVASELVEVASLERPAVALRISEIAPDELVIDLHRGHIDVGFVLAPVGIEDLEGWPFLRGTLSLLMSRTHPLAREQCITTGQVAGEYLRTAPRQSSPGVYDMSMKLAEREQLLPIKKSISANLVPTQVFEGKAFSFWPTVVPSRFMPAGLKTVPFMDDPGSVDMWILVRPPPLTESINWLVGIVMRHWPCAI